MPLQCSKKRDGWRSLLVTNSKGIHYKPCPECGLIHRPGKPEDGKSPEEIQREYETHPVTPKK